MNNFTISLQRFFKNKNTVTILGVIVIILILFFGYRHQVNKAVNPVRDIPVAAQTIQPRTKITSDMLTFVDISPIVLQSNVYTESIQVVGKYTNVNTIVPKGSLFYKEALTTADKLPNMAFVEVPDGQVPYNFPVDMDTTYGNSILPDSYIDIYMKAEDENGTLMVGKLVENVKVLAVKDSSGKHVFENSEEERIPATLIFGVEPKINILLRKASYMNNYSVELFPVPHGGKIDTSGATEVSSQTLENFINAHSIQNDDLPNTDENQGA